MSNYLLVIFDEDQSEADVSALSSLCDEIKMEKFDEEVGALIAEGYKEEYDFACIGTCYRVYQEEIPSLMKELDDEPLYIGRFDTVSEKRCVELATICKNVTSLKVYTEGIGEKALKHQDMFKKIFGRDCALDCQLAQTVEDMIWNDHQASENELSYFFRKRQMYPITR